MRMRESRLWTWQMATGVVILVLLGLHMKIMHLPALVAWAGFNPAGGEAIDWANVAHRARQAFFTVTYILLLAAALYHGLNGLRTILFELDPKPAVRRAIVTVLAVVGLGLGALGIWAAVAAPSAAAAAGNAALAAAP